MTAPLQPPTFETALDSALWWVEIVPVVPLAPTLSNGPSPGPRPLVRWKEDGPLRTATNVREFWERNPNAQIAIVLGKTTISGEMNVSNAKMNVTNAKSNVSTLFLGAIDTDPQNWKDAMPQPPSGFEGKYRHSTKSGGTHDLFFYRLAPPETVARRAIGVGGFVDVLLEGLLVVPPTQFAGTDAYRVARSGEITEFAGVGLALDQAAPWLKETWKARPSRSTDGGASVTVGTDGKIPHGRHHELIVSTTASLAARVAGISEAALVESIEGALEPLLDDLPTHRVEIIEAAGSAVVKFGSLAPAPSTPGPARSRKELRIEAFKSIRLQGVAESEALGRLEADLRLVAQPGELPTRELLAGSGLLEEWPIGWSEDESAKLAEFLTFEDVVQRLARVVDLPRDKLVLGILVAAQGHLAPLLRAIGPAIHAIPVAPRFSAGKTRTAHALTMLADGRWTDSATVPFLKSARKDRPKVLGIDEGDEAEKDSPGVKAYLLISHNWDAVYGKFSDPNEKGRRELEDIRYGGPVFLTFRKRPWPALESRAIIFEIEPSARKSVSDDGAGDGLRSLLLAPMFWLRFRCAAGLVEWDSKRALARIHEPQFIKTLDQVTSGLPILRQRDKARTLLFIAERLEINLTAEIEAALREEVVESENATVIEAIERDPDFRAARDAGAEAEIGVEALRLRVQKELRDHREFTTLTRNGFAAVLGEMEFSKLQGPTWKEGKGRGRPAVIFPGRWARGRAPSPPSVPTLSGEAGGSGGTGVTDSEIARAIEPPHTSAADPADLPAEPGSWMEGPVRDPPKRVSLGATHAAESP